MEERQLAGGQSLSHDVDVPAGHFVLIEVDQRGIDVVVRLRDPEGALLQRIDSPNGDRGVESLAFFSTVAGVHRIEVEALAKDAKPGRYAFGIKRREPAASEPAGRVEQLMSQWRRDDAPGATLAVMRGGAVVHSGAYGQANLEHRVANSQDTVFHVASVSKQFTAFAVTMLAQQGKLSLSDDVRKHLPEVPDFGKVITLEHLLHHTSGLRDQWALSALSGTRLDDVISRDHILALVARQERLNFDPGQEVSYCNTGFTLLAEVVARVSGTSFRDWTRIHIFEPLGMEHSHFHDNHEELVMGRADSYDQVEGGFGKSVLSYANVGATSLHTTAEDLTRWLQNLNDGRIGGAEVLASVHQPGVLNSGAPIPLAAGLVHGRHRGLATVGHGGSDAGFRAATVRYPDNDFAVVVLANLASIPVSTLAQQIAEIYLAEPMAAAEKTSSKPQKPAAKPQSAGTLDEFVGRYRLQIGMVIAIGREGDTLLVEAPGFPKFVLKAAGKDNFAVQNLPVSVQFGRDAAGAVNSCVFDQGGQKIPGERLAAVEAPATPIAEYLGTYVSRELDTSYVLEAQSGKLVARHLRNGTIALTENEKDDFTGDQWYFSKVRFERDASGKVIALSVSNDRMRHVRMVKHQTGTEARPAAQP